MGSSFDGVEESGNEINNKVLGGAARLFSQDFLGAAEASSVREAALLCVALRGDISPGWGAAATAAALEVVDKSPQDAPPAVVAGGGSGGALVWGGLCLSPSCHPLAPLLLWISSRCAALQHVRLGWRDRRDSCRGR